ncbi:aminoglycoside phosphotransferase family protein [Arboricoccus pini]|uniref:aminoglycoside phosphotransferase family protein n=1 Tax=Arboricoccus pini TaxID=1963835 RepID=UPI001A9C6250
MCVDASPELVPERHRLRWNLAAGGPARATRTSLLQPVRRAGRPAMLKVACVAEERRGGKLMDCWAGCRSGSGDRRRCPAPGACHGSDRRGRTKAARARSGTCFPATAPT